MKIRELTKFLESLAPLSTQESYDNSGLLVGHPNQEVSQALIALDCTEEIVDEAIEKGCDLIITHHPIIFGGLKKFNGKNYVERVVIKAIQNDIALYAIHTNLDNYYQGVNAEIAKRIGLVNLEVLSPKSGTMQKLVSYVPLANKDEVLSALFEAGAGQIGNYSSCSFSSEGEGTFKAGKGAKPYMGEIGEVHREKEVRFEVLVHKHLRRQILSALMKSHPYEEVAYELYDLQNVNPLLGSGMIGELENPEDELEFLKRIKKIFHAGCIKYTALRNKPVKKVALCGGAGSFLVGKARAAGADVYITGDMKYHEFFDAEGQLIIADIGHYESEQFTSQRLADILTKKFPKFALRLTRINTNPINYL